MHLFKKKKKILYINVYSMSIHNCPKLETTQMAFNRVSAETVVHPHHGAPPSNIKEQSTGTSAT